MMMHALFIDAPGQVRIAGLKTPEPSAEEVLLRIRRVGLCGTDLKTFRGGNPLVSYPCLPGHEVAATIERVGKAVPEGYRAGMDVTVYPYKNCGVCPACRQGRQNCCRENQTLGVQRAGAMTRFITAPWDTVMFSRQLPLHALALVEPLAVGFHAVWRGRITAADTVAVIGCGMIGLGAVAAAADQGARVIAVDLDARKLEVARAAGAAMTIQAGEEPLHERLALLTGEDGPDVVVEAVGLPETFRAAVEEVAFAGRVVYIGYAKAPVSYDASLFVKKELDVLGARNARREDFDAAMGLLHQGRFPVEQVITETVPLHEAGKALAAWARRPAEVIKIHVEVGA